MPTCPRCRVSFPPGIVVCPNDGEPLASADAAPRAVDPTASLAIEPADDMSVSRTGSMAPPPTDGPPRGLDDEISRRDLTRAERPSARGRRPHRSTGAHALGSSDGSPRHRRPRNRRPEERVGELLGNYKILDLLGRGGMGCVYRAEHVKLGRRVALKLLRDDHAQRRDAVGRFFQEARSVNRIRHRNIVDVTDFVELPDGTTFLVMELLEGVSLGKLLRTRDVEGPLALALLIQICDGLAAAHAMGIVHRDLKPDNIFVVPTGDGADLIKLLDFGVAKLLWREDDEELPVETAAGAVVGTPTYMSPEQAGGLPVDARSDIYSLGAIMYEMFTGQPVFRGKSFGEFVRKHLSEQPVAPNQTPGGRYIDNRLEAIILRCLAKEPHDRYPDIEALKDELMMILGAVETSIPEMSAIALPNSTSHGARGHRSYPGNPALRSTPGSAAVATAIGQTVPPTRTGPGDTAMAMGDLPATASRVRPRRGRWIALGLVTLAAVAAAVTLVLRDRAQGEAGAPPAAATPLAPARPLITTVAPIGAPIGDPSATTTGDGDPFTVRFLSVPSAGVFAASGGHRLCMTPCDLTIDPGAPGPSRHRDYILRQDGYQAERVRIDLSRPKTTVAVELRKPRRGGGNRGNRHHADEAPTTDTSAPPVVQPQDPDPDRSSPSNPKREHQDDDTIDPADTLDPFRSR